MPDALPYCISEESTINMIIYQYHASSHFQYPQAKEGDGTMVTTRARNVLTNHNYISVLESSQNENFLPPGAPPAGSVFYGIERLDEGAYYYRLHFFDKGIVG